MHELYKWPREGPFPNFLPSVILKFGNGNFLGIRYSRIFRVQEFREFGIPVQYYQIFWYSRATNKKVKKKDLKKDPKNVAWESWKCRGIPKMHGNPKNAQESRKYTWKSWVFWIFFQIFLFISTCIIQNFSTTMGSFSNYLDKILPFLPPSPLILST